MNPNIASVTPSPPSSPLAALPTAKIIKHPRSKKIREESAPDQPDEEIVKRLNAMAKQYPFCILHRGNNYSWLL